MQQGGHYFFRLWSLSLSRKASNAITKLPKAISKPITPMNIKMISAAVIGATSLPMYSGKPVIGSGGYHPCHGFHEWILPQYNRNFNSAILEGNKSTNLIFECHISVTKKIKIPEALVLSGFRLKCPLLHFNGSGRFTGQVVKYPVYALDLIDDPAHYLLQHVKGNLCRFRRH